METLDTILEDFDVKFIAYEAGNPDNVIASGNDAEEVIKDAEKTGIDFVFMFIPDKDQTYIL